MSRTSAAKNQVIEPGADVLLIGGKAIDGIISSHTVVRLTQAKL